MSDNKKPIISAVGLSKVFRDFWSRPKAKAVNDIDFEVYEGEVIGLLGPNGSGKSTTVKMILGLLYPTAGTLSVFGQSPRAVETKRQVGYLPEESYLYKYLTAIETLDFFGALFNLSAEERRNRSDQLLEMVGLSHARRRRVGEFSKGMARRIGLAQAMINDPSLLILDEPTSGLDPLGCKEVKDLILMLKKRGKTVLITSHLLSDVEDICDRVIILYGGKIRATGTLHELLTVTDANRITTPALNPAVTDKLISILRENLSGDEFTFDHPRKSLEQFFLEVINQAKSESIETAGVVGGGKIAEYLTENQTSEAILSDLARNTDTINVPEPAVKQEPAENIDEENKAIERLTADAPAAGKPAETQEKPVETVAKAEEDLSKANEKLKDLLS
ncbi:MAG: ABC transporter ATP-binding protein [Victivallaceae bacterium]|jgi:ABC-2 type transport system ATP-binding protein